MKHKQTIIKWLNISAWIAAGTATLFLLVSAIKKEDKRICVGLNIQIKGVNNHFFVDKNDILQSINNYLLGTPTNQPISSFDLMAMERELEKNIWVRNIQMYFDNNAILQVDVFEREPAARIFTKGGTTFYIDSALKILPLSQKFSARLPVFTNFPSDKIVLLKKDSLLLKDIYNISMAIQQDPFRMAMIDQVEINEKGQFLLVPKVGDAIIDFGNGNDVDEKFNKLRLFYKNVITKSGLNYYSIINLQFKDQVVAKKRDAADIASDSSNIANIMKQMQLLAEKHASDSMQMPFNTIENTAAPFLLMPSYQRDEQDPRETNNALPSVDPATFPTNIPLKQAAPKSELPVVKKNEAATISKSPSEKINTPKKEDAIKKMKSPASKPRGAPPKKEQPTSTKNDY